MPEVRKKVIIAGDVTVDWFQYPAETTAGNENWRLHPSYHFQPFPGGALLLKLFLEQALAADGIKADIAAPVLNEPLGKIEPCDVIHSNASLRDTTAATGKKKVFRVDKLFGYMGPCGDRPRSLPPEPQMERADLILLDDAGNGFRDDSSSWQQVLQCSNDTTILFKMSRPIASGELWKHFVPCGNSQPNSGKLVLIVTAGDLRQVEGVRVSKAVSWERTAKDVVFQLQSSPLLQRLQFCPYLIVLFGTDGALLYRGSDTPHATLIFDPVRSEGGFASRVEGAMVGTTAAFTASLAAQLLSNGLSALESGIKIGLANSRTLLQAGFCSTRTGLAYPLEEVFRTANNQPEPIFVSCPVEMTSDLQNPDPCHWRILEQKTRNTRQSVAAAMVRGTLKNPHEVPVGVFGGFEMIFRTEIENYGALRELLAEFLDNKKSMLPLSVAVFGPPGSGKSFGVKQVMKSVGEKAFQEKTFNISQFQGYQDLVAAFHWLRDVALEGKIPFVFFDEFDSPFEGKELGWLKYFLAPMQDGEFQDNGAVYHLGKAVFVFAGGTKSSYLDFANPYKTADLPSHQDLKKNAAIELKDNFKNAKGPDFVSRLRGFIDVIGPNPLGLGDDSFILRRAKVLRVLLKKSKKTAMLFDAKDQFRIDDGVLRALLNVREYVHGVRSMESVIDMSRIAGKNHFDLSAIPPREQLAMHVKDPDEFMFLSEQERYQTLLRPSELEKEGNPWNWRTIEDALAEAVAQGLHTDYQRRRKLSGITSSTTVDWEHLAEDKKESNRHAARDVPNKLRAIGHGMRRIAEGSEPLTPDITDEEIDLLARMEHDRFWREERMQGYTQNKIKNLPQKKHDCLIPFDELPADKQIYDIEAVRAIPVILKELGFEIYRMEEVDEIEDSYLFDRLARLSHLNYVAARGKEGETVETNISMKEYDALPDDMKKAGLDAVRAMPRKLRKIGYGLRRVEKGMEPIPFVLSDEEIEVLSKSEHARWWWQKVFQGWTNKKGDKDIANKTSPFLVPWKDLDPEIQDRDRQQVRQIPEFLKLAGYEAYKV
jgi:hypothetical protein